MTCFAARGFRNCARNDRIGRAHSSAAYSSAAFFFAVILRAVAGSMRGDDLLRGAWIPRLRAE